MLIAKSIKYQILNDSFKKIPQDVRNNKTAMLYFKVSIHAFNFLANRFFSFHRALLIQGA